MVLPVGQLAFERELQEKRRHNHRDNRRQEHLAHHARSGDATLNPQHNGRNIADGRERAARIGREDYERGIREAVFRVAHEFAQHHYHHDARGEIIENSREHEGDAGHAPKQFALGAGGEAVAHEIKAAVGIDDFNNRHGPHQEEQDFARVAEVAQQQVLVDDLRGLIGSNSRHFGEILAGVDHKQRPARHAHQQSRGSLVDFQHTL